MQRRKIIQVFTCMAAVILTGFGSTQSTECLTTFLIIVLILLDEFESWIALSYISPTTFGVNVKKKKKKTDKPLGNSMK